MILRPLEHLGAWASIGNACHGVGWKQGGTETVICCPEAPLGTPGVTLVRQAKDCPRTVPQKASTQPCAKETQVLPPMAGHGTSNQNGDSNVERKGPQRGWWKQLGAPWPALHGIRLTRRAFSGAMCPDFPGRPLCGSAGSPPEQVLGSRLGIQPCLFSHQRGGLVSLWSHHLAIACTSGQWHGAALSTPILPGRK